jgi:hypothetical protein
MICEARRAVIAGSIAKTHISRHSDNPMPKCRR